MKTLTQKFAFLTILLLVMTAMGAAGLNRDAIWGDEYISLVFSSGGANTHLVSITDIWYGTANYETWPPEHSMLDVAWSAFAGWTPFAGRTLSLLLGALTVAVVYRAGVELFGQASVGLAAATIIGLSAFFANYLHELRGYTLHTLMVSLALWLYWRVIQERGGRRTRFAFAASLTGLLFSHPVGAPLFLLLLAYHVLFVRQWRVLKLFFYGAILFLPWTAVLALRMVREALEARSIGTIPFLQAFVYAYGNGAPLLLLVVAAVTLTRLRRERALGFLWFCFALLLTGIIVLDWIEQFLVHVRHVIALLPLVALILGYGMVQLGRIRRYLPALALSIWCVFGLYNGLTPAFFNSLPGSIPQILWPDFHAALQTFDAQASPSDAIILDVAPEGTLTLLQDLPIYYYMQKWHYTQAGMMAVFTGTIAHPPGVTAAYDDTYMTRLQAFLGDAPRVWLAFDPTLPSARTNEVASAYVRDHYAYCGRAVDLPLMKVDLYALACSQTALH